MYLELLLTPFLLGLAGSIHCVGMCGPLILALPLGASERLAMLKQMAVYHLGRILTYTALGLFFGLLGKGIALAGLQKGLSLTAGILMILMAFMAWRFERLITALPGFGAFTAWVQFRMGVLIRQYPGRATFSMGIMNGVLPCGLVYAAIAGAISTTGGWEGAVFMLLFGLGTLPLLLMVSLLGGAFSQQVRRRIRLLQPVLMTIAGLILIQRGLHLDLSLFDSAVPKAGMDCH